MNGVITTYEQMCPRPHCENPVMLEGQCCPRCPFIGVARPASVVRRGTDLHIAAFQNATVEGAIKLQGQVMIGDMDIADSIGSCNARIAVLERQVQQLLAMLGPDEAEAP